MIVRQACRTEEAGRMAKRIFTAEQDGFVASEGMQSHAGRHRQTAADGAAGLVIQRSWKQLFFKALVSHS
jgi:hypothetical protein